LIVLRPRDANEVVEAYRHVTQLQHRLAILALSRQALPTLDRTKYGSAGGVTQGAYILAVAPDKDPEVILIASESEVILAIEAHEELSAEGIRSRVVSMPFWEKFYEQPQDYRESVLPSVIAARISLEQGSILGRERYVGKSGRMIELKTFGASAPLKELQEKFGFAPDRVVEPAKHLLQKP
jgi:transketolase